MTEHWFAVDIETTGLSPSLDMICEFGIVEVDKQTLHPMNDIYSWIVNGDGQVHRIDNQIGAGAGVIRAMHKESGLFDDLRELQPFTEGDLDVEVQGYLHDLCEKHEGILLGNTVGFDKGFIQECLPLTFDYLDYHVIDISSITRLCEAWDNRAYEYRPVPRKRHRVVADIQDSLLQLRYYRNCGFIKYTDDPDL